MTSILNGAHHPNLHHINLLSMHLLAHVYQSLSAYKSFCLSLRTDEPAFKQISSRRLSAEDFTVEKVIGRGAFGEVQLVRTEVDTGFKKSKVCQTRRRGGPIL